MKKKMKKILDKLKMTKELVLIIVAIIGFIISAYKMYDTNTKQLEMINKTTFYNHYQDIYALSEELESSAVDDFLKNFADVDMMLTDVKRFINGMHVALKADDGMMRVLFDGKLDELIERIETKIRKYYAKEDQMLVSFLIGGTIHLIMKSKSKNEEVKKFLIEVIEKLT